MFSIEEGIEEGLRYRKCPNCKNELSVIFGGLFGENYKKVKNSGIKYESGCCFDSEYYFCDKCKKYFNKKLEECIWQITIYW